MRTLLLHKKNLIISLVLIALIIFILLATAIIFLIRNNEAKSENTADFSANIFNISEQHIGDLNPAQIDRSLEVIKNTDLSDEERYKALDQLSFYFSKAYTLNHNPLFREHLADIDDYAKEEFSELHGGISFRVPCADAECGEPIDAELKSILDGLNQLNINPNFSDTLVANLTQAAYIPRDEMEEKKFGFTIVVFDLDRIGTQEASSSATKIRNYFIKKYSQSLNEPGDQNAGPPVEIPGAIPE